MKKLLIILAFIIPLVGFGQAIDLTSGGKTLVFQGSSLAVDKVDLVVKDYLARNPHYTPSFKAEIDSVLRVRLSPDYVMPDVSTNYYNTFIAESGQDRTDSDWLYVWKMDGNITTRTNTKTGADLKWQMGESVYDQDNTPAHTYVSTEDYVILTSADDYSGITTFNLSNNNFTDEICYFDFQNVMLFYLHANSFTGDLSNWASILSGWTSTDIFYIYDNSFTGDLSSWSALSTWTSITNFRIFSNSFTGDLSSWSALSTWSNLIYFYIYLNSFTGDLSGWSTLSTWTSIQYFYIYSNSFTGDLSSWSTFSTWTSIDVFRIFSNSFTGDLSSWSSFSTWSSVTQFLIHANSFTIISYLPTTSILSYNASINAVTSTANIDLLFSDYDTYFGLNTPIKNLTIDVSGGTNASPTGGASNTNIVNLISTFTTAGYTFTAIIN